MNNQPRLQPHYSLPGVMHYLQTEFTKNERDRITWELERAEMKARIAQLEGENKDLHYKLMKYDMQIAGSNERSEAKNVGGDYLPDLLKSKMAVQESVKEIIYLFKSPEVATQFGSLNEERDPLHEMQKLNLNQNIHDIRIGDLSGDHLSEMNLHHATNEAEMISDGNLNSGDVNSDAATIVLGSDTESSEPHDTTRRRSSSLFAVSKEPAVDSVKMNEDLPVDATSKSSLFTSNGKTGSDRIVELKAFEDQVLSYSQNGRIQHWKIDTHSRLNVKLDRSFDASVPNFLDFYWLDSNRFLVFDYHGVKLYATQSSSFLDNKEVFKELNFNITNVVEHDFINNWLLFVSANRTIQLLEVSTTTTSTVDELALGKSYTIEGERAILSARFGMTEKSLIVLYNNPCELVIYNYQGKVLQRVDISKQLRSIGDNAQPSLILNKKSSKLLIALGSQILVYSFDQKKVILNEMLSAPPTSIIFKTVKNCMVFAYAEGTVEIRKLKDFDHVTRIPVNEDEDSKNSGKVTCLDCTLFNSKILILTGSDGGMVTVQKKSDLIES